MSETTPEPQADSTPDPQPEPVSEPQRKAAAPSEDPLRASRTSGAWTAVIISALLLVLLIIFIVQNTDDVRITFLAWEGDAPLAVALLVAAVAGILITAIFGTMRIWQLRRRVKRDKRAGAS